LREEPGRKSRCLGQALLAKTSTKPSCSNALSKFLEKGLGVHM
jgi:hypothetical protein